MTITMTAKHQITIPKMITDVLRLGKGSIFDIKISKDSIELMPLETKKREFGEKIYKKLEALSIKEKGKEEPVTRKFIESLKKRG